MELNIEKINISGRKILEKTWHWPWLIALALFVFLFSSYFSTFNKSYAPDGDFVKWGAPDENANYIFSKLYGQTGELSIFEKYNLYVDDIMYPRSFRSDYGEIKPVSFLGISLIYGFCTKIIGYKAMPYFTPFLAALGILFYYFIINGLFGKKNALLSATVLSFFPPYLYYSSRSMFHNILFVVLLLAAVCFLIIALRKRRWRGPGAGRYLQADYAGLLFSFLAGSLFGLAFITRTSELLWLVPSLLIAWIFYVKDFGFVKLSLVLAGILLGLLPAFYHNQLLYGSPFFGGYSEMNQSLIDLGEASSGAVTGAVLGKFSVLKESVQKIQSTIFYFGFDSLQSLKMFKAYFVDMFKWLFWPSFLGLLLILSEWKKLKKKHWLFMAIVFVYSLILIFYYGSWEFHDNPDPDSVTIGNSYTRYWLPVYLAAIPLLSYYLAKAVKALAGAYGLGTENSRAVFMAAAVRRTLFMAGIEILVLASIAAISLNFVLFGSEEGLIYTALRSYDDEAVYRRILSLTESNSVIITRYHDKILFPERKVIVGLFDDPRMIDRYYILSKKLPLYYFNFSFSEKDIDYLNERRLKEAGLSITPVKRINQDFSLYRLAPVSDGRESKDGSGV